MHNEWLGKLDQASMTQQSHPPTSEDAMPVKPSPPLDWLLHPNDPDGRILLLASS